MDTMRSNPRSTSLTWLARVGLVSVLATACGSATVTSHTTARATPSPSATPISATPTLPVIPPPPPIPPLLAFNSTLNSGETLYSSTGARTGSLPTNTPYNVVSPLGDRLLAEHRNGGGAVDSLYAMTATGATSKLETISNPADFIDAIGSGDGTRWAWMLKGTVNGCVQPPPSATTYLYIGSTPGASTLVAKLPPLKGQLGWTFYQWTAAGIVLDEGGRPGCYEGPRINVDHTDLLNPATGALTPLGPRLGTGDCILQDIADDGTVACVPNAVLVPSQAPAPSATVLRIVFYDGTQHNVTAAEFLRGCDVAHPVYFGNVSLSSGPDFVSLTRWCSPPHDSSTMLIDTWIIDIGTLEGVKVSVSGLGATGWLPGTATLIATGDQLVGAQGTAGTYAVAADGTAAKLISADVSSASLAHY
jgi:hypothetical protein